MITVHKICMGMKERYFKKKKIIKEDKNNNV